ncbi:hypothetical protein Y919_12130 [Caloranaerobacter azorensis H53214]|uniref:Uncharacterized protein n=1 Tax=Caloranaerobacter azorensis H53214 TaxID=1156417 RepID=A0A096BEY7_9FIRM|nr:hypothetical protein [Caloranaerobacter azorensis]KGG79427.1 hypothetical protein Y919_12130 [Caloranaerobacter azorensis H53214]
MNSEAYKIRSEINRLKARLKEIDEELMSEEEKAVMCASNVCGQDVVLDTLQTLCRERGLENIAVMACWQKGMGKKSRWYSTTITPSFLPYLIRDVDTLIKYLKPLMNYNALKILEYISIKSESIGTLELAEKLHIPIDDIEKELINLSKNNFIKQEDGKWESTLKGWQTYIVLSHLAYNYEWKLETEKALKIAEAFKSVLNKEWGEPLNMTYDEVMKKLSMSKWLEKLYKQGIKDSDIEKAVYENNYLQEA